MNVYLIVHPVPEHVNTYIQKPAYVIGVDRGLFDAYKAGIDVDIAIGDFDSLKDEKYLEGIKTIRLNPKKDKTDTESALDYAYTLNYEHIYILGGIGGERFEHSYNNLLLLFEYNDLTIQTTHSMMKKYKVGTYQIDYSGYINIYGVKDAVITLSGFKYNLDQYKMTRLDRLGISNELEDQFGTLEVLKGEVVVIYSKK